MVVAVHTDTQIPSLLITTERANRWMFYFKDEKGTFKTASVIVSQRNGAMSSKTAPARIWIWSLLYVLLYDDAEVVVT